MNGRQRARMPAWSSWSVTSTSDRTRQRVGAPGTKRFFFDAVRGRDRHAPAPLHALVPTRRPRRPGAHLHRDGRLNGGLRLGPRRRRASSLRLGGAPPPSTGPTTTTSGADRSRTMCGSTRSSASRGSSRACRGSRSCVTDAFRHTFAGFDPGRVARFDKHDVTRLLKDVSIVRHHGKIEAAIANARATLTAAAPGPGTDCPGSRLRRPSAGHGRQREAAGRRRVIGQRLAGSESAPGGRG